MNKNPDAAARGALAEMAHKQRPHTLIEEAYRKIKQMLLEQKFAPGQRLVNSDLAEILSMSRTPIINALNRLVQDGFIGFEGFRGFYVRSIDTQEVWDAFGVREALEVYAMEQAIKLSDTRDMVDLEEKVRIHAEYKPHYYTRRKFILDSEFHLQIATMAKNRILRWLLKRNFEHIFLRARLDHYDPRRMVSSAQEHHELVERMKKKDILGSVERVRSHIQKARDEVVRCLSTEALEEAETVEV
ncbi:MAG: GntR family transcriptional regulator [Desulfobacteraceae bacterium]|jgi:DNA-binding GntR family transcriptional regulator